LQARLRALLNARECWIERTRPQTRRINLRPYLRGLRLGADTLEMDLWVTPTGAARPEEILAVLGLGEVLAAGAVLERSHLELSDDNPTTGDNLPAELERPTGEPREKGKRDKPDQESVSVPLPLCSLAPAPSFPPSTGGGQGAAVEDQPRSTPLIPGPMTFDS
jgi:hypothetical protein